MSGNDRLKEATSGGSVAILTDLDPAIVKSDSLTGNVVSLEGKAPGVFYDLKLEPRLLERVVGSKEDLNVEPIKKNENLMLNVNSSVSVGIVDNFKNNKIHLVLKRPLCISKGDRITLSRMIGARWRLIGVSEL